MTRLKRVGLVLAAASLWAGGAGPILAADNGTVDAQVTVATPCLTVTTPAIDFGTLPFTPEAYSSAGVGQQSVAYESCAGIDETIFARGTDATGPSATWQLSADGIPCLTPDPNLYRLSLTGPSQPAISLALRTTDQELETVAAGAAGATDQAHIQMPCAGADGAGETMTMQIVLTATF